MEILSEDGVAFSAQALLDPGSYSIHNDKSSLDENVSVVSYVSEEVANLIANKTQKSKFRACTCKPAKSMLSYRLLYVYQLDALQLHAA